jgi:hypothetical protein
MTRCNIQQIFLPFSLSFQIKEKRLVALKLSITWTLRFVPSGAIFQAKVSLPTTLHRNLQNVHLLSLNKAVHSWATFALNFLILSINIVHKKEWRAAMNSTAHDFITALRKGVSVNKKESNIEFN